MNQEKINRMRTGIGFIAALDQSGGSTPKALLGYGIDSTSFKNDDEMFDLIHQMRSRIITSKAFTSDYILGAILFEQTMDRLIEDKYTADYLWDVKGVLPFLKVDAGLADEKDGVQLMKDIPSLDSLLARAVARNIFGTKMRSVIKQANLEGIKQVVHQQFDIAKKIAAYGLIPIIEPEVDIHIADKKEAEILLKHELINYLNLNPSLNVIFKLSIPTEDNFYQDLMDYDQVLRVVALSGGYTQKEANHLLSLNHGLIASFSRALAEGLTFQQTQGEFDTTLAHSIHEIAEASKK